jgi:hypothetical protein
MPQRAPKPTDNPANNRTTIFSKKENKLPRDRPRSKPAESLTKHTSNPEQNPGECLPDLHQASGVESE